ncbi:MAG: restriction endonuclease subunit S, partial [Mariprofundaceae bacterium]|nr:restriction endonuclease subunit S [Mariprofundaceae bacterium]
TTVPQGWVCKRLIECTDDESISYGIVQPGQHVDNGIPVIRINNVNNGQLDLEDVLKVSPEIEHKYERTRLHGGEVLLTLVGSTGQSFVAPKELKGWNVPRAIAVIRAKSEIGADWINICLQSQETKHFLDVRANTTVQKTLNLKDVRDIPILIPPKEVKESIENMALSLSNKIELNRQMNQTLEDIAQALFKNWFVDFEPVKAKMIVREKGGNALAQSLAAQAIIAGTLTLQQLEAMETTPLALEETIHPFVVKNVESSGSDFWMPEQLESLASLFPNALTESELGEIPEGWIPKTFGDVSQCFDSKRIPLSKKKREEKKPGQIPYHGATSVMDYVNEWIFDDIYLLLGEDGSVIKKDGSPFVQYIWGKSWVNNHAHVLQGKNGVSTEQLMLFIQGQNITAYITGAVQLKLNQGNMNSIPFLDAGAELNAFFYKLITPTYKKIRCTIEENQSLTELRDTLLPKLLSGELTVSKKLPVKKAGM